MDRQLVLFSVHPVHPQWDVSINIWLRNDMMDHFPCQWLLVLVWLKPLFPSVFLVRRERGAQLRSHLRVQRENALVILLRWTLSSNLHIANNKIIDRIVDHKHFTSFQIGFYSLFTTIRYLKCKVIFFTLWNCIV